MALPVRRSAGAPLAVEQWDPFRELIQGVFGNNNSRLGPPLRG